MSDDIKANPVELPRVWVKRPPWWRPFARREFDRGIRALGQSSGVRILPKTTTPLERFQALQLMNANGRTPEERRSMDQAMRQALADVLAEDRPSRIK